MEPENMNEEVVEETPAMDAKAKKAFDKSVNTVVEECLKENYASENEYIDALIGKLEALRAEPEMGGMGEEAEAGMPVPDVEDED